MEVNFVENHFGQIPEIVEGYGESHRDSLRTDNTEAGFIRSNVKDYTPSSPVDNRKTPKIL